MVTTLTQPASDSATRTATVPPAHMPALDGLRGLAVLSVIAYHSFTFTHGFRPAHADVHGLLEMTFGMGWAGVDLFFVLSGFLITGILLATKTSGHYFSSFWARRFLRIFPLYYLFVVVTIVAVKSYSRGDNLSLVFFYYNFHAIAIGRHLSDVSALWSLAVEEQFYLVWPVLVYLLPTKYLKLLCGFGVVAALVLRVVAAPRAAHLQGAYFLTPYRVDELFGGALLAIWRTEEHSWKRVQRSVAPAAGMAVLGLIAILLWTGHPYPDYVLGMTPGLKHTSDLMVGPGISLIGVIAVALVAKCVSQGTLQRIFLSWPLRRLGKYSYGMYLLHWYLLARILRFLRHHVHRGDDTLTMILFPLVLAVTFVAAWLSFQLFERHFLRLKRLFPAV